MSIVLNLGQPQWMEDAALRDILAPMLPGVEMYCGPPERVLEDVTMLAVVDKTGDVWAKLPNLKLIQKLGAGVNHILAEPGLPEHVAVARLASPLQEEEIAEYCLAYVLHRQRNMGYHEREQAERRWSSVAPRRTDRTTVGVLGLGRIGGRIAELFAAMRFRVLGWSRSAKSITGVKTQAGDAVLPELLKACDYVITILPSTPQTVGLFDRAMLANMKPGATLINVGRGDLIVEDDLMDALDRELLGDAVLDVVSEEPLPAASPLWSHPKITITPHVSGWHVDGSFEIVAENYRRLTDGQPLLHVVDKAAGY